MSRYIDADLVKGAFQDKYVVYDDTLEIINSVPTADVRPNVHGEWQVYYDDDSPQDGIWKCSICGYIRLVDDISPTYFCPNCGADMRKGAKNE